MKYRDFTKLDNQLLLEDKHDIKKHLPHLEDLAVEKGTHGFYNFYTHVYFLIKNLQGEKTSGQQVNLKVDGSMMILFGIDPREEFKGQFFISTKAGMSKLPKLLHSCEEIDLAYLDINLTLKLKRLFTALSRVYTDEMHTTDIYQADVLFTDKSDKQLEGFDSVSSIAFTPNTITYKIEYDKDPQLWQRVYDADVGIVIHEVLKGIPCEKFVMLRSKGKDISDTNLIAAGDLNKVFIEGSNFKDLKLTASHIEITQLNSLCQETLEVIEWFKTVPTFNEHYILNAPIIELLKRYLNSQVTLRAGGIFGAAFRDEKFNFKKFFLGFRTFIIARGKIESLKRKTARGRIGIIEKYAGYISWIEKNEKGFNYLMQLTYLMMLTKQILLKIFNRVETKFQGTFVELPDGTLKKCSNEGFVISYGSNHVKIVNRLEFTKYNKLNKRLSKVQG